MSAPRLSGASEGNTAQARARAERGVVLIQVAVAIVGLIAFTVFVIDYGVLWVARAQAQNAADAAALAGAVSLAYDDPPQEGARTRAIQTAAQNPVWGQPPVVLPGDVTFPTCPDGTDSCVRVDVYRSANRGSQLPSFFGPLLGIASQRVRATATAQAAVANASECLKPWAIPDKWQENFPEPKDPIPWSDVYTYDAYDKKGNPLPNPDVYRPATDANPTGYTVENDFGTQLTLKAGNPHDAIAPGWFFPVVLPRVDPCIGGDCYRDNIASCNGVRMSIGDWISNEPGNMIGPTKQGVDALIAQDRGASWGGDGIVGGCMAAGTCTRSPRMVALPLFDVAEYAAGQLSGRQNIRIVNIIGFFIEGMQGNDVIGRITHYPGAFNPGAQEPNPNATFQRVILLVQ